MAGAASLFRQMKCGATAPQVNELLAGLLYELRNAYHTWFRRDCCELQPRLPRRHTVTDAALVGWLRACEVLRRLPACLPRWEHDEESVRLLYELAVHPAAAVHIPAGAALMVISRVPPVTALDALLALDPREWHYYVQGLQPPTWWRHRSVDFRARYWERACVALAEHLYADLGVLADLRGETLCQDDSRPDIIVGQPERDERGHVQHAPTIIDAKSGGLPHRHSYLHLCDRLEYWHAGYLGEWVRRGGDGRCRIIYRDRTELEEMAPPEIARTMADLRSHLGLYLQFIREQALAAVGSQELAAQGTLLLPEAQGEEHE